HLLAPQFRAGGSIDCIEVAAGITEEHESACGRCHGSDDRVVGPDPPLPFTRVSVDGVQPSAPVTVGAGERAERIRRVEAAFPRPELPGPRRGLFLLWSVAGRWCTSGRRGYGGVWFGGGGRGFPPPPRLRRPDRNGSPSRSRTAPPCSRSS